MRAKNEWGAPLNEEVYSFECPRTGKSIRNMIRPYFYAADDILIARDDWK